ncbi:TIGR02285 family protein [Colwellia sp. MEBiC06753]
MSALQLIGVLFLVMISINAFAKDEIIWYSYDQPPASFEHGEYKGTGFLQRVRSQIITQLPQYNHLSQEANVSRMIYDKKQGKQVCYPALIRTKERENYIDFSDLAVMHYKVHVLMKAEQAQALNLHDEVDIEQLFSQHGLVMARVESRSYTTVIDKVLANHSDKMLDYSTNSITQLYQMLERGRVDIILTYPSVANFNLAQLGITDDYVLLAIKGIDKFIVSPVGCSKSEKSEQLIANINLALAEIKKSSWYFSAMTSWLKPSQITDDYRQHYNRYIAQLPNVE